MRNYNYSTPGGHTYMLPDGFTVDARGEADSDWNGFPVPILSQTEYLRLGEHLDTINDEEPYAAGAYVDDGKVTPGFYCDGIAWVRAHEYEPAINNVAGATLCWTCAFEDTHPIHNV